MEEKKSKQISIRFPFDLYVHIAIEAKEQGRSFNAQVIWILRAYMKQKDKQ